MSGTTNKYLTKRSREEKKTVEDTASNPKRPRLVASADINDALMRRKFFAITKQGTVAGMHRLLMMNLRRSDNLFRRDTIETFKNNYDTQLALKRFLMNQIPYLKDHTERSSMYLNMLLSGSQCLQLKELIAYAVIRQWISLDNYTDRELRLLPLFTTETLPQYKAFIAELVAAVGTGTVLLDLEDFKLNNTWNVVNAAYATNNILLLQWCADLCDANFEPILPTQWFQDAVNEHKSVVFEETNAWVTANVPGVITHVDQVDLLHQQDPL